LALQFFPYALLHPVTTEDTKTAERRGYKWYLRWFYPTGLWGPSSRRRMYAKIFSAYAERSQLWFVFPLVIVVVVNVAAVVHPQTVEQCRTQYGLISCFFGVSGVVIAVRRPLRATYKNVLTAVVYWLFCVSLAGKAVFIDALLEAERAGAPSFAPLSHMGREAQGLFVWSTIVQLGVVGLRSLIDMVFSALEMLYWVKDNQLYGAAEKADQLEALEREAALMRAIEEEMVNSQHNDDDDGSDDGSTDASGSDGSDDGAPVDRPAQGLRARLL